MDYTANISAVPSTVASRNSGPRNSGITRYSGHFAADGRIHYYESRLYHSILDLSNFPPPNLNY